MRVIAKQRFKPEETMTSNGSPVFNQRRICDRPFFQRIRMAAAISFVVLLFWIYGSPAVFRREHVVVEHRNVDNMAIGGNEFWTAKDESHFLLDHEKSVASKASERYVDDNDLVTAYTADTAINKICSDFFVLWPGDCIKSQDMLDERMRTLSAQMTVMGNSTLHFFTTDKTGCNWEKY